MTPTPPVLRMGLAIDPTGEGVIAIADQATDRVNRQPAGSQMTTTLADAASGLRNPGPPVFADLNGDGIPDLVYADGGADEVHVYLGKGNGSFPGPPTNFAVGTNPTGVTVAKLNGNQSPPDLIVANEGSNDISILIGQGTGAGWTLVPGPRLQVVRGQSRRRAVDFQHNGVFDLVVSETLANDVRILPGLGRGFFNDRDPTIIIPTPPGPGPPVPVPTGPGKIVIAVPDAGADSITLIDGETFKATSIPSQGETPVAIIDESQNYLLVANEGDGHLGVLGLDPDGDVVSASFLTDALLPHLSVLASLEVDGTSTLYATTEAEDSALLFPLGILGGGGNCRRLTSMKSRATKRPHCKPSFLARSTLPRRSPPRSCRSPPSPCRPCCRKAAQVFLFRRTMARLKTSISIQTRIRRRGPIFPSRGLRGSPAWDSP